MVNLVGLCDIGHSHARLAGLDGTDPKFIWGVLGFLHLYVVGPAFPLGKSVLADAGGELRWPSTIGAEKGSAPWAWMMNG
jgi:hypothetical protein